MPRRQLTLTLRTLCRRLGYTIVSSLGLTVALACTGLVALYLQVETSYDTFHDDADRIGRVFTSQVGTPPLDSYRKLHAMTGQALQERVAGVEAVSSLDDHSRPVTLRATAESPAPSTGPAPRDTEIRVDPPAAYFTPAGDGFFEVFDGFELLSGSASALDAPGGAILTQSMARRLFGTDDAVGRTFTLVFGVERIGPRETDDDREMLTVRAVTANPPVSSHVRYDVIYSVPTQSFKPGWLMSSIYVKLTPGADRQAVLDAVIPAWGSVARVPNPDASEPVFEPLTDIYLNQVETGYLWALGVLAIVILIVAGANYTNLAAAMYASRSREVGARKAVGAREGQIARQFVLESIALAVLCVPPAMGLASILTPAFNHLMETALPIPATDPVAWLGMTGGAVALGAVAGVYPARGVARRTAPALFSGSDFGRGRGIVRRGLIVAQFALFIALGSAALLLQQQVDLLQEQRLGFAPDGLVEILNGGALVGDRGEDGRRTVGQSQAFQRELRQHPSVVSVATGSTFLRRQESPLPFRRTDTPEMPSVDANFSVLDPEALDVVGVSTGESAYFRLPEADRPDSVAVVSQSVLDALACEAEALASSCTVRLDAGQIVDPSLPVVGVIDNVRFGSLRRSDLPEVIFLIRQEKRRSRGRHDIFVRFREDVSRSEQQEVLEATWASFVPDRPLQVEVLADRIDAFYAPDRRLRTLSMALTGIAMVLLVLGLLAITAYLTRLRLKEVAIRKALGASVGSILQLLNREFAGLVAIAFFLGTAGAYLLMNEWLSGFATRISISPLVFATVGLGAFGLAVTAVTMQSLSAARVNPASVLQASE